MARARSVPPASTHARLSAGSGSRYRLNIAGAVAAPPGLRGHVTDGDQGLAGGTGRRGGKRSGLARPGPRGDEPDRPLHSGDRRGEVVACILGRNARGGQRTAACAPLGGRSPDPA